MWPDVTRPQHGHQASRPEFANRRIWRRQPVKPSQPDFPRWLAMPKCHACRGTGVAWRERLDPDPQACKCVQRAVFRICLHRYRCYTNPVLQFARFAIHAEYRADFELSARRALDDDDYAFFRRVFVLGVQWPASGLSRGNFFHSVYRIQQRCGWRILQHPGIIPERYFTRPQKAAPQALAAVA